VEDIKGGSVAVDQEAPTMNQLAAKELQAGWPPEPSEQVKRVNGIVASIHQRREERARLVADKLRRGVEIERADREAQKGVEEFVKQIEEEAARKIQQVRDVHALGVNQRRMEFEERGSQISKLDKSLEQLRKQLDVELGKLDPDRKVQG